MRVPLSVAGLEARNLNLSEDKTINNLSAKDLEDKMVTVEKEDDAFNKISQVWEFHKQIYFRLFYQTTVLIISNICSCKRNCGPMRIANQHYLNLKKKIDLLW